eukprot:CAMPEP_0197628230 /NCGR_PEP_ID=MMETSP1338-20131121/6612_1 /TAXON_ID=43686 ORGANISM="Pelagodinium beii, Strain RCC1491" /NCGR_SAMPLE_ID=MMETSP1338 /ASSEMBLY_ACC=CAM_ASM_000754 /LENGTH=522 /DNA_ID=CAMNT_0043199171 /DNA_START=36 /DNA_END=1600 /DNA_ORIENTATION=+
MSGGTMYYASSATNGQRQVVQSPSASASGVPAMKVRAFQLPATASPPPQQARTLAPGQMILSQKTVPGVAQSQEMLRQVSPTENMPRLTSPTNPAEQLMPARFTREVSTASSTSIGDKDPFVQERQLTALETMQASQRLEAVRQRAQEVEAQLLEVELEKNKALEEAAEAKRRASFAEAEAAEAAEAAARTEAAMQEQAEQVAKTRAAAAELAKTAAQNAAKRRSMKLSDRHLKKNKAHSPRKRSQSSHMESVPESIESPSSRRTSSFSSKPPIPTIGKLAVRRELSHATKEELNAVKESAAQRKMSLQRLLQQAHQYEAATQEDRAKLELENVKAESQLIDLQKELAAARIAETEATTSNSKFRRDLKEMTELLRLSEMSETTWQQAARQLESRLKAAEAKCGEANACIAALTLERDQLAERLDHFQSEDSDGTPGSPEKGRLKRTLRRSVTSFFALALSVAAIAPLMRDKGLNLNWRHMRDLPSNLWRPKDVVAIHPPGAMETEIAFMHRPRCVSKRRAS